MSNKRNKEGFTILIDTNAVTAISLYLEICDLAGKDPINELEEIKRSLETKNIKREWLRFDNGIKNGFKAFTYLKEKVEQYELRVYLPLIEEIEALHLIMERKFDEILTRKGIPYRLRTKRVIRTHVDFDYNQIYENWLNFKEKLEYYGIELILPEKEYKGLWKDIFLITNLLMKYILLENIDMLIYAISLYIRVDEIYTFDREFRTVVNHISHGSTSTWRRIAEQLERDLINNFSFFKEEFDKESKIKFPKGVP